MVHGFRIQRPQLILAVLSGLLYIAAFPKVDIGWLAWVALVPLFLAVRKAAPRPAFAIGFAAGLVQNLGLVYWTEHTMHLYGGLPLPTALLVLIGLAGYMALYTGLFAFSLVYFCRKPWQVLLLSPAAWVALEMIRAHIFTGFPWELLGYSQYDHLWVLQWADMFGVYGISVLIVAVNAAAALALLHWLDEAWQEQVPAMPLTAGGGALVGLLLVAVVGYGATRLQAVDRAVAQAPHKRVTVVQGNIDQAVKWDAAFQLLTAVKYKNMSLAAVAREKPDLVVWPETATPFYFLHDELLSNVVLEGIKSAGTWFLIGSPSLESDGAGGEANYNSAYLMTPQAGMAGKYDKVHLVPFGEYVPLKPLLSFLGKIVAQVGDFKAGRKGNVLAWEGHPIGVQICYEIIFPELSRAMVRNGAQILVNITNDAWFGRTSAAYQHFSMAVFRAVENRRSLARAANTGISGFVDPAGRILGTTALYEDATATADLPLLKIPTHYTRWGDWPLGVLVFGLMAAAGALRLVPLLASRGRRTNSG